MKPSDPVKPGATVTKAKPRAHTRYYASDGELVPGVTTVIGLLDKPALVIWANRMGLQGVDTTRVRGTAQRVGTLTHELIKADLNGEVFPTNEYTSDELTEANQAFRSYLAWRASNIVEPILVEAPLASDDWKYGGTVDLYAKVNGKYLVVDFKTGAIYEEAMYQTAAYRKLIEEDGQQVDGVLIVAIEKGDNEDFTTKMIGDTGLHFALFTHLLAVYRLKKMIAGEYKSVNRPEIVSPQMDIVPALKESIEMMKEGTDAEDTPVNV